MKVGAILLLIIPISLTQSACKDTSSQCSSFVRDGLCNNLVTKECMERKCALSCGRCSLPTADPNGCGRSRVQQSRIIAGVDAKPGAWPWIASLWMYTRGHICGGSLLNPKWILTAGHCIAGSEVNSRTMTIILGGHDHRTDDGNEQIIGIERIINHPQFSRNPLKNDIALIKLKTPAKLNSRVQAICLPSKNSRPAVGFRECYLAGWGSIKHPGGSHNTLQQAMLPIVDVSNCFNNADILCTGYGKSKLTNACRGDSGGPFVCRRGDGSWEQHGVTSFVVTYCKYYTAFTQVSRYIDWINQYVNDMS